MTVAFEPGAIPTGGIHVGAFGFSNPEWLLEPLGRFRVETLILLEMPGGDRARARLNEKGIDVDHELARVVHHVEPRIVDLWNPGSVAAELIRLADGLAAEGRGPAWVNISTGPNPWCVAANLAASFADMRVYHVDRGGHEIIHIPTIRQPRPTARELALLSLMPRDGAVVSGTLLKRMLREQGFFRDSSSEKPAKNREQGQLNSALPRLLAWGAVLAGFHGSRRWYRLGPAGACLMSMFA